MAFEDSDRRRTILLAIITLIALPALWFVTRSDADSAAESAAADQVEADSDVREASSNGPNRPPIEQPDQEPVFMDGPESQLIPPVAEIAVPPQPEIAPLRLAASYRSSVSGQRTCLVKDVDSGLTVTVTNLDNGRSITCVTSFAPDTQTADIVLKTSTFSLLADLTEAPIPVEVVQ